jgi:phosphotriesterase-related protein
VTPAADHRHSPHADCPPPSAETDRGATGLNVIASTGFYVDAALPDDVRSATVEQLTQMLIDDVASGGLEQIRRGAIGEIGIEGPTELELRCVRAAGRAQKRTGAPVFLHVMSGIFPQYRDSTAEVIGLYKAEGGDLRKLVLCHQDGSGDDQNYQAGVLERGIWMEYDTFGFEGVFALGDRYIQLPTDTQRISEVKR